MVAKQRPLLGSGVLINGVTQPVGGRREHILAETVSIREWTVLSTWSVPRSYKKDNWGNQVSSVREAVKKTDRRKEAVGRELPFRHGLSPKAED
jgi:hypothetical protein